MSIGRIVWRQLKSISVAADATQDLWSILGSSVSPVRLLGFELTSADIAAEAIKLDLHRITTQGTGGSTGGVELADEKMGASVAVFHLQDVTTQGANGGGFWANEWEQLGPTGLILTPEMQPVSKISEGFALSWESAVAATISGFVCWEEL